MVFGLHQMKKKPLMDKNTNLKIGMKVWGIKHL